MSTELAPIPMRIPCPECGELHIDEGEFATKSHHTHACQHCGMVWRPAVVPTVGVRFLPGYRNEPPTGRHIDELELSVRSHNVLTSKLAFTHIEELLDYDDASLEAEMRRVGANDRVVREVLSELAKLRGGEVTP